MRLVVTAGPTVEPLDAVRRLTNFSSGRLGTTLASFLAGCGHRVILLLSEQAVYRHAADNVDVIPFSTTASLRRALVETARQSPDAVFHAAAVCDFRFGTLWRTDAHGHRIPVKEGKVRTGEGPVLAELLPTPKLIAELREWYPRARLTGWKYAVDGTRDSLLRTASEQLRRCRTDLCVANGPAYGQGFGLVAPGEPARHFSDPDALFHALLDAVRTPRP